MEIFLARFTIKSRVVRYMKKNQMVMKNLVYVLISVFCLACFCSCSIKEKIHNRKEERALAKEEKKRKAELKLVMDSIKVLESAYKDDTCIHVFDVSNRKSEFRCVTYYPENAPDDFRFSTAYLHMANGKVYIRTCNNWPQMLSSINPARERRMYRERRM